MSTLSKLYQKYGNKIITSSDDISELLIPNRRKREISRVIMIGGSEKYCGALIMSGLAGLRNGMHGVVLIAPENVCNVANTIMPSGFMTFKIDKSTSNVPEGIKSLFAKWKTRALIGPGMEKNENTIILVKSSLDVLIKNKIPILIDANALDIIIEEKLLKSLKNKDIVLTPNEKELNNISESLGLKVPQDFIEKIEFVKKLSKDLGMVICAKGRRDIITDGKRVKITYAADPIMSTAKCGDILNEDEAPNGICEYCSEEVEEA